MYFQNNVDRYHGLDALRAFAMILGIVLHSGMFYLGSDDWNAYSQSGVPEHNSIISVIFIFIHTWRMPIFFLLAGFFARLLFYRRGSFHFTRNRFIRIVLPLIFVSSIYNFIFLWGSWNNLHHLWFLYYLVYLYIFVISFVYLMNKFPIFTRISNFFSSIVDLFFNSLIYFMFFILALMLSKYFSHDLGMFQQQPNNIFDFQFPFFAYCTLFFLIGWILNRNPNFINILSFKKTWIINILIGIASLISYLGFLSYSFNPFFLFIPASLSTWFFSIGLIGFFHYVCPEGRNWVKYIVDASYWIYLFHLLPVMMLGIIFLSTGLQPLIAFFSNIVISTILSVATYHGFIRYTPIGWVLNGRR
ncbi:MAG: hypothetical protein CL785_03685 [Chloroflexi bacterium]|nr:hypothetical protein [Chloroflexota bacterium]|tara:strand:- start:5710 stop:6789 length:1080 start_codon:yes stop_codon:yes gene_type:complete